MSTPISKQSYKSSNVMKPEEYASHAALTDGKTTINVTPRLETKTADTVWIPAKIVIPSAGITKDNNGFFLVKNVKIRGIANPADGDKDVRNKYTGTREVLQTSISGCPDFGPLCELLEPQYIEAVEKLQSAGQIKPLVVDKKVGVIQKPITGFLHNKVFGDTHPTKAGQVNPDPIIRFAMDFSKFHDKCPITQLRDTPITQIFDARTRRIESKMIAGKVVRTIVYDLAQIDLGDGKMVPVDKDNMHFFITEGSVLVEGRILIDSAIDSKSQVSLPIKICRAVIQPGETSGDMDDTIIDDDVVVQVTTDTVPVTIAAVSAAITDALAAVTNAVTNAATNAATTDVTDVVTTDVTTDDAGDIIDDLDI